MHTVKPRPLRTVVTYSFSQSRYTKPGQGQHVLELDCGHKKYIKTSIPVPKRARCYDCWRMAPVEPSS